MSASTQNLPLRSRRVLHGLALGFLLVLVLLGASGAVAVWRGRVISENASQLTRDHLLMPRLIHDVQTAQSAMTEVFQRITQPGGTPKAPLELLRELDEIDQPIEQPTDEVRTLAEGPLWDDLESTLKSFTRDVREILLSSSPAPPDRVRDLFEHANRLATQVDDLIRSGSIRLADADRQIESQSRKLREDSAFLLGTSLLLAVACAGTTILFVRQSIERMKWQSGELDRVSWHMLQGQEAAARRFSHELHDELGQSLAAVRSNLTRHRGPDLEALRSDCLHLVDQSIANVRELSQLLRPVILDDFGLEAGLKWLADSFSQITRLGVDFRASSIGRYSDETETHLFRIAQEAFTNIARHCGAGVVAVRLHSDGQKIVLHIEDDGRGLGPAADGSTKPPSLGMTGMRARARQCGSDIEISPVAPHRLRVVVTVPVRVPEAEPA